MDREFIIFQEELGTKRYKILTTDPDNLVYFTLADTFYIGMEPYGNSFKTVEDAAKCIEKLEADYSEEKKDFKEAVEVQFPMIKDTYVVVTGDNHYKVGIHTEDGVTLLPEDFVVGALGYTNLFHTKEGILQVIEKLNALGQTLLPSNFPNFIVSKSTPMRPDVYKIMKYIGSGEYTRINTHYHVLGSDLRWKPRCNSFGNSVEAIRALTELTKKAWKDA